MIFSPSAFLEYLEWQRVDKSISKKINELIIDISRNGLNEGIGKPEPLKRIKAWSRRIDKEIDSSITWAAMVRY